MGRVGKKDHMTSPNETRGARHQRKRNVPQSPPKQPAPKRSNSVNTAAPRPAADVPMPKVPASVAAPHGAAAFLNSRPSPGSLPAPPAKFFQPRIKLPSLERHESTGAREAPSNRESSPEPDLVGPDPQGSASSSSSFLSASSSYRSPALRHLHGTLLHARLAVNLPQLASKITGMLLELEPAEVSSLLEDPQRLGEYVDDALDVLRAAADTRALEVPMGYGADAVAPSPHPAVALSVAVPNADDFQLTNSSLTPVLAAVGLRVSPRYSSNPYSTSNFLAASALVMVGH